MQRSSSSSLTERVEHEVAGAVGGEGRRVVEVAERREGPLRLGRLVALDTWHDAVGQAHVARLHDVAEGAVHHLQVRGQQVFGPRVVLP